MSYERWPYKLCLMCSAYSADYRIACVDFLRVPAEELDVGFGLRLQSMALRHGSGCEAAAVGFLLTPQVQDALTTAFEASAASSLPVERRFAQTKRNEAPRLCSVAVASRNNMQRQFLRWREQLVDRLEAAEKQFRRAMKTNLSSLAWEKRPECVIPVYFSASPATQVQRQQSAADLREYVSAQRAELSKVLSERREAARSELNCARDQVRGKPLTRAELASWFADNSDAFYESMRVAAATRRERSRRLSADPSLPAGATRLQSRATVPRDSEATQSRLFGLLKGREG